MNKRVDIGRGWTILLFNSQDMTKLIVQIVDDEHDTALAFDLTPESARKLAKALKKQAQKLESDVAYAKILLEHLKQKEVCDDNNG